MINKIPCKCLLISSLSGLTRKRGMARASLAIPTRFLVAPDKLDIKRHKHGILYILSRVGISKDASLRASVDISTRNSIRRYQCSNPFII